ncbi:MAG: metal-dependent hydrolase, partial [Gemmatimonadaceae bacterium]
AFTPLVFESYPWSHSLLMLLAWGLLLGAIARWRGADPRAMWLVVALVVSHWVLDFVTHAPDMPLWPGNSPRLGLGLWNSIPGTLLIEGAFWVAGLTLYLRRRRPRNWVAAIAFWSLVVISTLMWATGPWSPLPATERELAWFALIGWIVVPWAIWADRGHVERAT